MHRRLIPRPSPPENGLYFSIDVRGRGATQWRLPFAIHLARITDLVGRSQAGDGEVLDKATDVWMTGGAAIGLCWADQHNDLEADRRSFGRDLLGYGEAVLEELHEAGWTMAQIGDLYPALLSRIASTVVSAGREVGERADFFEAQQGKAS